MYYPESTPFPVRGFNLCESILRHSPDQLRTFIRRMKSLKMNTLIVHYDYGWKRYRDLILEECRKAGVEITLMTFGPRTFFSYTDWTPQWFAKDKEGKPRTTRPECETHPCRFEPAALDAFEEGAVQWLKTLPGEIRRIHMRAGDGCLLCECAKCRQMPEFDRWQPFVDRFAKAVRETRPDLEYETDVYYKRYRIPTEPAAFSGMSRIMFDTFYRQPLFPLTSKADLVTASRVQYGESFGFKTAEKTVSEFYYQRLLEWEKRFPGKTYIHENAMMQCYMGAFQYGTSAYLVDLEWFRKVGIQGVCYEAYEPGYAQFAEMFEILGKALSGEKVEYEPDPLEQLLPGTGMFRFCDDPSFPLEKYVRDPFQLQQLKFNCRVMNDSNAALLPEYLDFAFSNQDKLDPILIGWSITQFGSWQKKIRFRNLSPEAKDFITRRKLWDFMEDIPLSEDPKAVCHEILKELIKKAE